MDPDSIRLILWKCPVPSVEIKNPLKPHLDLLRQYTDDDMHNILAYLETLK